MKHLRTAETLLVFIFLISPLMLASYADATTADYTDFESGYNYWYWDWGAKGASTGIYSTQRHSGNYAVQYNQNVAGTMGKNISGITSGSYDIYIWYYPTTIDNTTDGLVICRALTLPNYNGPFINQFGTLLMSYNTSLGGYETIKPNVALNTWHEICIQVRDAAYQDFYVIFDGYNYTKKFYGWTGTGAAPDRVKVMGCGAAIATLAYADDINIKSPGTVYTAYSSPIGQIVSVPLKEWFLAYPYYYNITCGGATSYSILTNASWISFNTGTGKITGICSVMASYYVHLTAIQGTTVRYQNYTLHIRDNVPHGDFIDDGSQATFPALGSLLANGVRWQDMIVVTYSGHYDDATRQGIYVKYYNTTTAIWSASVMCAVAQPGADVHSAPKLVIDYWGYIHIFFGCHSSAMHYVKSSNPGSIATWGSDTVLWSEPSTYPYPFIAANGTMYVLYRQRNNGTMDLDTNIRLSLDNGVNWGSPRIILDGSTTVSAYYYAIAKGDYLHIFWESFTQGDSWDKNAYYAKWSLLDKHVYTADGTDRGASINVAGWVNALVESSGTLKGYVLNFEVDGTGGPRLIYLHELPTTKYINYTYYAAGWVKENIYQTTWTGFITGAMFYNDTTGYIDAYIGKMNISSSAGAIIAHWVRNGGIWTNQGAIQNERIMSDPAWWPLETLPVTDRFGNKTSPWMLLMSEISGWGIDYTSYERGWMYSPNIGFITDGMYYDPTDWPGALDPDNIPSTMTYGQYNYVAFMAAIFGFILMVLILWRKQ